MHGQHNGWGRFRRRLPRRSQPARSPAQGLRLPRTSRFRSALASSTSLPSFFFSFPHWSDGPSIPENAIISAYPVLVKLVDPNFFRGPQKGNESGFRACRGAPFDIAKRSSHPSQSCVMLAGFFCPFSDSSCSFGSQNSGRDFGGRPMRHPWACQKQPLTKMTFRRDGKDDIGGAR